MDGDEGATMGLKEETGLEAVLLDKVARGAVLINVDVGLEILRPANGSSEFRPDEEDEEELFGLLVGVDEKENEDGCCCEILPVIGTAVTVGFKGMLLLLNCNGGCCGE